MKNYGKILLVVMALVVVTACSGRKHESGTLPDTVVENTGADNRQAVFVDGVFRIATGGKYVISGEHVGQIFIEVTESDIVELLLDDMALHNPNGPAIFAPRPQSVGLILAEGTINTISGAGRANTEINATIYVRNDLTISGDGSLTINSDHGHGIQAVASIVMSGGTLEITSERNGMTSNGSILIMDGAIRIPDSYEGIEGFNVTVTGGDIDIFARDDGINARDSNEPTGGTRGRFGINDEMFVRIAGGNVRIHALRDGIDSNGNTFLEGGTLHISAPSLRFGDDAIDQDGFFLVTGGKLVTAGTVRSVSSHSTQPVIFFSHGRQIQNGSHIKVKDAVGHILLEYTAQNAFSMSALTSPAFIAGETFIVHVNGERTGEVTIEGIITNAMAERR